MASSFPLPPYSRDASTLAARNAIPNSQRREGMEVYVDATQLRYDLLPQTIHAWDGTDADWVLHGQIPAFLAPTFSDFWIDPQAPFLATGATISSGDVIFSWRTFNGLNILSVTITDLTAGVVLATDLVNIDDFRGSSTVTLPSSITNASPATHVWQISGEDAKGNAIPPMLFEVDWLTPSDTTYYVRDDGSDSNTGLANDSGHAFLTLQKGADVALPGDTIRCYRTGNITGFVLGWDAPQNGCASHPITFDNPGGATVNHRNAQTHDGIDVESCNFITIDGFTTNNDGTITRAGIRLSGRGYGNKVKNCTVTVAGRFGIFGGFQNNSLVESNVCHDIGAAGAGTGHGIYWSNSLRDATLRLNACYNCPGDGIHLNGDISNGGTGAAERVTVERNTIHDTNRSYGGAGINPDGLVNSFVWNNILYNCHSAGITLYQIDAAWPSTGNTVANNTILLASDSPKWAIQVKDSGVGNHVFNNIVYSASTSGGVVYATSNSINPSSGTGSHFANNIYLGTGGQFALEDSTDVNLTVSVLTLAQWQAQSSGLDANSFLSNTLNVFTDYAGADFTIPPTSDAYNVGVSSLDGADGPADDYNGDGRPFGGAYDVGAYESQIVTVGVIAKTPAIGTLGVAVDAVVTITFDRDVDPDTIVFALHNGGSVPTGAITYNSGTHIATFTPDVDLDNGVTWIAVLTAVTGIDSVTLANPISWSFTTVGVRENLLGTGTPSTVDAGDGAGYTLGMKFRVTVNGNALGVRFYKSTANTGTHIGHLLRMNGDDTHATLLATVTFTGETSSGWQEMDFASPVALSTSGTYMVAVVMPNGHYAYLSGQFTSPVTNGHLVGIAAGTDGYSNGSWVDELGSLPRFAAVPGVSYFVDVIYQI